MYREPGGYSSCLCYDEDNYFRFCLGSLCIGSVATAAGYIGCFKLVQDSSTRETFIWLALEAFLAVLRIILWGCNRKFDKGTWLILELRGKVARQMTTQLPYEAQIVDAHQAFSSVRDREFLRQMRVYMRPGAQCIGPDTAIQVFYATALSNNKRNLYLLTTIYNPLDDPVVVVRSLASDRVDIYSAICTPGDTAGVIQIQLLEARIILPSRSEQLIQKISEHSKDLIGRFQDPRFRINRFRVSWTGEMERCWSTDVGMYDATVTVV
jgi:hypothetical protein